MPRTPVASTAPRRLALFGVLAWIAAGAQPARAEPAAIAGSWATRGFGSVVELRPCVEGGDTWCGRIVWLWEPNDADGRPRLDEHHPDDALRARPLLGIEILRGLRESAPGEWTEGEVYNPDDGRTYTGRVRLRAGALELTGCALRFFCQTQTWRRPADVFAALGKLGR